jgi:DNA invertase Pin-like site-specific DNA recombinase
VEIKRAYRYSRFSTDAQGEGDSKRRQTDLRQKHCRDKGLLLDDNIKVDEGISSFHGRNAIEGELGKFIALIKAGRIERGSALLVEAADRISRQKFSEAYKTYQEILAGGVEIHFISMNKIMLPEHSYLEILEIGIAMDLANKESERKSELIGATWSHKRKTANGNEAISKRVPLWLSAKKGKKIEIIPERARDIRMIFELRLKGLGRDAITKELDRLGIPPWVDEEDPNAPPKKRKKPKKPRVWDPVYVGNLLRHRALLGEYSPHRGSFKRGCVRVPDGEPIKDYYPAVIDMDLWQRVREMNNRFSSANFVGKFILGSKGHGGGGTRTPHNLFSRLVFDASNDRPMNYYRRRAYTPSLISKYRAGLKENKIDYRLFVQAFVEELEQINWDGILSQGESDTERNLKTQLIALADRVEANDLTIKGYDQIIDAGPKSTLFERTLPKLEGAILLKKELAAQRNQIDAKIQAERNTRGALENWESLHEIVRIPEKTHEIMLKLRAAIAQRVTRIDLWFPTEHKEASQVVVPTNALAEAVVTFANGVKHGFTILRPEENVEMGALR